MVIPISSDSNAVLDDDEMAAEWEALQAGDIDYASIYACSEYLAECKQLLITADLLLALLLGCLCASIFSRFLRS